MEAWCVRFRSCSAAATDALSTTLPSPVAQDTNMAPSPAAEHRLAQRRTLVHSAQPTMPTTPSRRVCRTGATVQYLQIYQTKRTSQREVYLLKIMFLAEVGERNVLAAARTAVPVLCSWWRRGFRPNRARCFQAGSLDPRIQGYGPEQNHPHNSANSSAHAKPLLPGPGLCHDACAQFDLVPWRHLMCTDGEPGSVTYRVGTKHLCMQRGRCKHNEVKTKTALALG